MQRIKTALLSFGMSGRVFHAPFIHAHPGFELAGAWERSAKNIQQLYPETKSYSSLEELLHDDSIALVVVNTPTYTHYEFTRRALEAGKHVIVEKAFTTTAAEAEELKTLATEVNRKLSVFQNRRWDSDFKTVQHIISKGVLGDLVEVSFSYDRYNPALSPKLHKEIVQPGAGVVHDLGPHLIDQALVLFKMPQAVFADLAITRASSKVYDYFEILLLYPSLRVRLRAGYFVREPAPSYIVHGTKGSFLKTRADVQETDLQAGKKPSGKGWGVEPEKEQGLLHTEIDGKVVRDKIETLPGNYMEYYDGIYRSLANDGPLPVTADEGVQVMRITDAAFDSHREKRIIELA
ncbi:MAG: Gfo/Idh/MocA family oxidoreductase [Cyclobacteriaceae bacterium]|nr:Gfo/Idh/MocA family oxidoreductase [Cyclobacteriaceae bacterium]UYN87796.1 MAG: Gfo/Idh/MocA family oxidoreductase [Cyclobacteriaceae bacterium]